MRERRGIRNWGLVFYSAFFIALPISVGIVRPEEGPWLAKLLRDGGVIVTCGSVGVVRVSSRDLLLVLYISWRGSWGSSFQDAGFHPAGKMF